ncbi:hypothetical protein DNTS_015661 [Danionella cerebrum]|uniref:G-protein coupled receptors family 1 profile domain-containing protein n=1 Tax=Danionella cerebrum TaxID=2873325 RepID=A0A553MTJ1_9TELE|nr:hypothetical protein DNTS_015661 [Danionella translucida]
MTQTHGSIGDYLLLALEKSSQQTSKSRVGLCRLERFRAETCVRVLPSPRERKPYTRQCLSHACSTRSRCVPSLPEKPDGAKELTARANLRTWENKPRGDGPARSDGLASFSHHQTSRICANMGMSRNETVAWSEATNQTDTFGPEVVIVPVIFGCIFFLGIIGNTLVMVVIGKIKSRRSRSTTNIFILNLSIADLSFLLFCVPFQATIYSLPEWIFGAFMCKFVHYFVMVSMLVSIFTLMAMSVDRYIAVVLSKKSPCIRNRRNALIGVCVIWTLSFIFAVPVAQHQILTNHPKAPNSTFCWEIWTERVAKHTYKVTILVIGYLLPLLLITCCYAKVRTGQLKSLKSL